MTGTDFRCGYCVIFGLPNAGKSTLLNALLGTHLAITSSRPQTTRRTVLGIYHDTDMQCIFRDTPGLIRPRHALHKRMVQQIHNALADADLFVLLADCTHPQPVDIDLKAMNPASKPVILALNKTDLVDKRQLLPLIGAYNTYYSFKAIVPISAAQKDGLERLMQEIRSCLPIGPPLYPADMLTDQPERFFVAELIREQVFRSYHEEIPHACEVIIREFKEREKGKDYIYAVVFVERESQKGILIGAGGEKLKEVASRARQAIEQFLGRGVYLELQVKVNPSWRKDDFKLDRLGY